MPRDDLVAELAELLAELRPASRFHLMTALRAAQTEGVGGALVIEVPRKGRDPVEVTWVGGRPKLTLE